jgi:hypothetical protein
MKKAAYILCSIIIPTLILSCEKTNTRKDVLKNREVYAGQYDSSLIYHEFDPPWELAFVWDNENIYGLGKDSMDIDSDKDFDIMISAFIINPEKIDLIDFSQSAYPSYSIELENNFSLAVCTELFPIGQGSVGTAEFVDTLNFGVRVDVLSAWSETLPFVDMWQSNPGFMAPSEGSWFHAGGIKYIGLKKDSKHGWIEVDATDANHLKFTRFAVQK